MKPQAKRSFCNAKGLTDRDLYLVVDPSLRLRFLNIASFDPILEWEMADLDDIREGKEYGIGRP